ncbi:hypothetical protein SAMN04487828_0097 [Prevotella sp. lc2012]|nr:hypothetical protein SAMN04487828_0097 [Prevotella sp. lc2012]
MSFVLTVPKNFSHDMDVPQLTNKQHVNRISNCFMQYLMQVESFISRANIGNLFETDKSVR